MKAPLMAFKASGLGRAHRVLLENDLAFGTWRWTAGVVGHRNPARSRGRVASAGITTVQSAAANVVLAKISRWTS